MLKSSALYRLSGLSDRRRMKTQHFPDKEKIPSKRGGRGLPPCVEVGHAAFELVPSQKQEATSVGYGRSALLLTFVFIIDEQLSPVGKIPHHVSFLRSAGCP